MKRKIITISIATMLFLSLFTIYSVEQISATESIDLEYPWFHYVEDDSVSGYTYLLNYTSTVSDNTHSENDVSLGVMVESVRASATDNKIHLWVAATGRAIYNVEYVSYPSGDYYELYTTAGLRLKAEIGDVAPSDTQIDLDRSYNYRANMTEEDNDQGGTKSLEDHMKNTAIWVTGELIGQVKVLGTIYSATTFIAEEFRPGGARTIKDSDVGPSGTAFEIFKTLPSIYPQPEYLNHRDQNYLYSAGTHFTVTIPSSEIPDEDLNIRISATNIMGYWEGDVDYGYDYHDGAESYVDITIKNGKLMNPSASVPVKELHTSDFTAPGEDAFVYPGINIDLGENFASDDAPFYDVRVYIPDKDNFGNDKLLYTFEYLKPATPYMYNDIPVPLYWEDWRDFDDGLDNGNDRVRVPVRRVEVEAKQEYGGWVQDIDSSDMYWDIIYDSYGVSVEAPLDAEVTDYGIYEYEFKVSNTGSAGDTYELFTTNTARWSISAPETVVVGRGDAEYVTVAIAVTDGEAFAGDFTKITLTAASIYTESITSDSMILSFQPGEDYPGFKINEGNEVTTSGSVGLTVPQVSQAVSSMNFRNELSSSNWYLRDAHIESDDPYDKYQYTLFTLEEIGAEKLKIHIGEMEMWENLEYGDEFADYLRIYDESGWQSSPKVPIWEGTGVIEKGKLDPVWTSNRR